LAAAYAPVRRFLELGRGFLIFPLEIIQPVILRFYLLFPLEQRLLELLVLRLGLFCARDRGVCLGAERSEFLFGRFGVRKKVGDSPGLNRCFSSEVGKKRI